MGGADSSYDFLSIPVVPEERPCFQGAAVQGTGHPCDFKVKKYKIKGYSSFKSRFRTLNDGNIRRWRAGKRHNAHLKSKKAKRRLRRPEVVTKAYAKVMKKLHFCA